MVLPFLFTVLIESDMEDHPLSRTKRTTGSTRG